MAKSGIRMRCKLTYVDSYVYRVQFDMHVMHTYIKQVQMNKPKICIF